MRALLQALRSRLAFSLFWKIYLTLVACLALVALAIGALVYLAGDDGFEGLPERGARFFAAMLPPASGEAEVERLAAALGAELALRDANGRLLAGSAALGGARRPGEMDFVLADGRTVLVRLDGPWRRRNGRPFLAVVVVALTLALGASGGAPPGRGGSSGCGRASRPGARAPWRPGRPRRPGRGGGGGEADRAAETVERLIGAHHPARQCQPRAALALGPAPAGDRHGWRRRQCGGAGGDRPEPRRARRWSRRSC
ncbi:MAG: hypothetical protein R3C69_15480 [Geminicoccaceae bacterium]